MMCLGRRWPGCAGSGGSHPEGGSGLVKMDHTLYGSRQPQVDGSTRTESGWSVMSQWSLGASLGEQIIENELQLGQNEQGYMAIQKGILVIVQLRNVSRFTKASGSLGMLDVADNTKPRRLNMPRAASQGALASGRTERDLGARVGGRSLPSSTSERQTTTTTFCFLTATVSASVGVWPKPLRVPFSMSSIDRGHCSCGISCFLCPRSGRGR